MPNLKPIELYTGSARCTYVFRISEPVHGDAKARRWRDMWWTIDTSADMADQVFTTNIGQMDTKHDTHSVELLTSLHETTNVLASKTAELKMWKDKVISVQDKAMEKLQREYTDLRLDKNTRIY